MRLNFACGATRWPGFENTDITGDVSFVDLTVFPYPYESDSAELIMVANALMMGQTRPYLGEILAEFHRILEPGGWLRVDEHRMRLYGDPDEETPDAAMERDRGFSAELRVSREAFMDMLHEAGFKSSQVLSSDLTLIPADIATEVAIVGNHGHHHTIAVEAQK